MAIKLELIAPFVTAAAEVLHAETGTDVSRGQLRLDTGGIRVNGVAAMISLLGQVEGLVMFSMASDTCRALISRMVGEEFEELNELVQSGIAELSNVVAGRLPNSRTPACSPTFRCLAS